MFVRKRCLLSLLALCLCFAQIAMGTTSFNEGEHYRRLPPSVIQQPEVQTLLAQAQGKKQIFVFFSYACYWCSELHASLDSWVSQQDVSQLSFKKVPVIFDDSWEPLARAYYLAQLVKKEDTLDKRLFNAVQKEHRPLMTEVALSVFFEEQGVRKEVFKELYHSFALHRKLSEGKQICTNFRIMESPALVIHTASGDYLTTLAMAGSKEKMNHLLDHLIKLN